MLKDKIQELIAIIEESGVNEIEVSSWWGRKIRVTKNSSAPVGTIAPPATATPGPPIVGTAGPPEAAPETSRHHTITAPIVGTFYAAASPESPPFIKVGDRLKTGQTICIIEAMKIMNEIESDVDGTVVEILPDNATPVEFNQPLVVVDPA
ncbi:MAG: acetyl-CoA carboxylase biotin carboxyl carrier protein [Candidatus Marinimicrobia bacterium]|nr:acetyl-CoA carboxylase biotin carboxyl carrier protein [Candidatus Neomarinimicrobiota bacterium]